MSTHILYNDSRYRVVVMQLSGYDQTQQMKWPGHVTWLPCDSVPQKTPALEVMETEQENKITRAEWMEWQFPWISPFMK